MGKTNKILYGIMVLSGLLICGAIFIWSPVCDGLLELKNGNMVYMKCTYMAKSASLLALLIVLTTIFSYVTKQNGMAVAALSLALFFVTFESIFGIGICMKETMACHTTVLWIRGGAIIAFLACIFIRSAA